MMASFWDMGGYAAFVWPSWIIAILIVLVISARSVMRARAVTHHLASLEHDQKKHDESKHHG